MKFVWLVFFLETILSWFHSILDITISCLDIKLFMSRYCSYMLSRHEYLNTVYRQAKCCREGPGCCSPIRRCHWYYKPVLHIKFHKHESPGTLFRVTLWWVQILSIHFPVWIINILVYYFCKSHQLLCGWGGDYDCNSFSTTAAWEAAATAHWKLLPLLQLSGPPPNSYRDPPSANCVPSSTQP